MIILIAAGVLLFASAQSAAAHPHPKLWAWYRSSGARCVHHFEGSWAANTGNGYYGGFQMDRSFMRHWNPRRYWSHGTADHWTATHQTMTVRRAVRSIGWSPWPATAAYCGLL